MEPQMNADKRGYERGFLFYLRSSAFISGFNDMRLGFLGTGSMGLSHVKLVRDEFPSSRVEISAVCDTHAASLANAFEDPRSLIASDVDAIVISTPGFTHADFTESCLAAGKHVFAEKPVMTTHD